MHQQILFDLHRVGIPKAVSFLLMATIIGALAAFAWLMASIVWGMMGSLAATASGGFIISIGHVRAACPFRLRTAWPGYQEDGYTEPRVIW